MGKNKNFSKKRFGPYWKFGQGKFTQITFELKESVAYLTLTSSEKLILLDMIRVYSQETHAGHRPVPQGFPYTWRMCKENLSEPTFQKGVRNVCEKGFFEKPLSIQDHRSATATRYISSIDWEKYDLTETEERKLNSYSCKKENRLIAKAKRATDFRVGHKTKGV